MYGIRRQLHLSTRVLNKAVPKQWTESVQRLLSNQSLSENLPKSQYQEIGCLEPYEIANRFKVMLEQNPRISFDERVNIHNKLIEEMTRYEFAVAAIHSKELQKISAQLSIPAFIEVLRNNPGRVKSSWEFFEENYKLVKKSDQALVSVIEKLVYFDPVDIQDGKSKMTVQDLARTICLISLLEEKSNLPQHIWEKIILNAIQTNSSIVLPVIFEGIPNHYEITLPLDLAEITDYQIISLLSKRNLDSLFKDNKELFVKYFSLLGVNDTIHLTEDEIQAYDALNKELERLKKCVEIDLQTPELPKFKTQESFDEIVSYIISSELDKNELDWARMMLRYLGLHKGDTKMALKLYHEYLMAHPSHYGDLMYEMFLCFAYQSFVGSNDKLLQVAETLVPSDIDSKTRVNILRALILVNSKSDPHQSLQIFNNNIQNTSKEKNPITEISDSALLVEALILAFLRNKDRDFAHVIFEGAAREKIIDGPTSVKRIKNILTLYGESIEQDQCQKVMDEEIERVLKAL